MADGQWIAGEWMAEVKWMQEHEWMAEGEWMASGLVRLGSLKF